MEQLIDKRKAECKNYSISFLVAEVSSSSADISLETLYSANHDVDNPLNQVEDVLVCNRSENPVQVIDSETSEELEKINSQNV